MKTVDMPKMGDTMEEGKILRWLKAEGDEVKKGEPLAEIETDKVNIEIESFSSGILRKILIQEGDSAPIGAAIALIGTADEPLPDTATNKATSSVRAVVQSQAGSSSNGASASVAVAPALAAEVTRGRIFISPVARLLAQDHQLDYTQLRGSGPNGRIIKMDIEAALATRQAVATAPAAALPFATSAAPVVLTDGDSEIPLTSMRRTIARRLSQSAQTAPHIYVTSVIDTDKLGILRQQINEYAAKDPAPVKISYNDLVIRAVARALQRIPAINVVFAEDRIIQKKQINVGVAVALEQGLIVPVVHNVAQLSILDLARETRRLAQAAHDSKLKPDDLTGGTFTVSNLGMFGVDNFTAIINPPESAILAVGAITPTPVVVDGQVVVRDRMKVTLSADHRSIDGALAARFLQEVKRLIEEPFGLLL